MKHLALACVAVAALSLGFASVALADGADVIFVVDESGSMGGEHSWLTSMISDLDSALVGAGLTGNRFGLVGFGASSGHGTGGHKHLMGGDDWGTAAEFSTAAGSLATSGFLEDGWHGIDFALDNYSSPSGRPLNIVLVTDEDRDNFGSNALSYLGMLAGLNAEDAILNVVINGDIRDTSGSVALGRDANGDVYLADGSGGYTTGSGGSYSGTGNTESTYMDLAWATGGAAWDLNELRAGGFLAESFTNAFVDIKVEEIVNQVVPEPGTIALLGLGLAGLGLGVRRRRKVAA